MVAEQGRREGRVYEFGLQLTQIILFNVFWWCFRIGLLLMDLLRLECLRLGVYKGMLQWIKKGLTLFLTGNVEYFHLY